VDACLPADETGGHPCSPTAIRINDRHLLEAVFGSFNPLRLHMKLAGGGVDYTSGGANPEEQ
jgi:hypothetical protein